MMIDASAIVAILNSEPDADLLARAIDSAGTRFTTPLAVLEATAGLMRESEWSGDEASAIVRDFLATASVEIVAITENVTAGAVRAYEKFGRGRHPAQLNLNDCFAYACAKELRTPLLFKGNDFLWTDIENALTR